MSINRFNLIKPWALACAEQRNLKVAATLMRNFDFLLKAFIIVDSFLINFTMICHCERYEPKPRAKRRGSNLGSRRL